MSRSAAESHRGRVFASGSPLWSWGGSRSLLLSLGGGHLAAQGQPHPPRQSTGVGLHPPSSRHIQEVEPRSGPPGTQVRIYTENMPSPGKVLVGVGAIGVGFEGVRRGSRGSGGMSRPGLQIPESATHERPLRINLPETGLFSPVGLLGTPSTSTDGRGLIRRTGRVRAGRPDGPPKNPCWLEGTHRGERYGPYRLPPGGVEEGGWVGVEGRGRRGPLRNGRCHSQVDPPAGAGIRRARLPPQSRPPGSPLTSGPPRIPLL